MSDIREARRALIARVLEGDGTASTAQRRAAFDNAEGTGAVTTLISKVAYHAHKVTDEDIAGARAAGLSADQIFEVVVCAAIGQATRQHDSALDALEAAAANAPGSSNPGRK